MSLHVIFGTGPLGLAVAASLNDPAISVRLVSRSGEAPPGYEDHDTAVGDLTDPSSARRAAEGADVIYHCAGAPYTEWKRRLPVMMKGAIDAAAASRAKLVYGDNLYAYAPSDQPLTEETPEEPTTRKGKVRKETADLLRSAHERGRIESTIGRASDFYGPGVRDSFVGSEVFGRLSRGNAPRVLGNPDHPHTFTYIGDFGRALTILAACERASGQTWHVPNSPPISTREFALQAAVAMDEPSGVTATPSWLVHATGFFSARMSEIAEMLYEWENPWVVDHAKFQAAFGDAFGHPEPLHHGIQKTAAWFRGRANRSRSRRS